MGLRVNAMYYATNKHASFVCESILLSCCDEDRHALADALLGTHATPGMPILAGNQFGCHVVRAVLRLPGKQSQLALEQLRHATQQLHTSKFARRVLEEHQLLATAAFA